MLGFLSEEDSIVNFNTLKKELNDNYEKYRELLESYIKITNNTENQDELKIKKDEIAFFMQLINSIQN